MNGNKVIICWDGKVIAATKVNEIQTRCNAVEKSSPTQGKWDDYDAGRKGWSVNTNYLVMTEPDVAQCLKVGNKFTLTVCENTPSLTTLLTGEALLTVCDVKFPRGGLAEGAIQFVGCGPLEPISVQSITIIPASLSLAVGETGMLGATILPVNATFKEVSWSSSNTNIATVDQSGVVTAVATGSCNIICKAMDGSSVQQTCSCTVSAPAVPVDSVTLSQSSLTMRVNDQTTLSATISPNNASVQTLAWSSSDTSIATVTQGGVVTAVGQGSCTITCAATDGSGEQDTCSVVVSGVAPIPVTGLTLNQHEMTLALGDSSILTPTITPANATDKTVTWTTSDSSIADVDSSGNVTAVGDGTATITCTSHDNSQISDTCDVTVLTGTTEDVTTSAGTSSGVFNENCEIESSSVQRVTGYIPVQEGDIITYSGQGEGGYPRVVGYSDNAGSDPTPLIIAATSVVNNQQVTIGANTTYIRCCGWYITGNTFKVERTRFPVTQ